MNGQDVIAQAARALSGLLAGDGQDYPRVLTRAAAACMQALAPLREDRSRPPTPGEMDGLDRALQDLSEILDTERRVQAATEAISKIPGGDNRLETARIERDCRRLQDALDRRGTPDPSPDDLRAAREELAGSAETAAERRDWADELEELLARLTAEMEQPPTPKNRPPATGTYTQVQDYGGLYSQIFDGHPIEGYTRRAAVTDPRSNRGDELAVILNYRDLLYRFPGTAAGPYYQRVYGACASLYHMPDPETGIPYDNCFSLTEIWRKMGNTGKPVSSQLDRVYEALRAMRTICITIPDSAGRVSDEYLLNLKFKGSRTRSGYIADAVYIVDPPPLARLFCAIKQYTQIPDEVMAVRGLSQTDGNIQLQDYLDLRIGTVKRRPRDRRARLIKWETLRANNALADWARGRNKGAYKALDLILKHYRDCGQIAGYTLTDRGIEIRPVEKLQ